MQALEHQPHRRDFATDTTLFRTTALAVVIAAFATLAAVVLLNLIRFFTNLFFFQTLSLADRSPATNTLGAWVIAVPLIGGLIVGLMARFGSEKIRGHGIPEAIEAILFGKSKMSPKVAVLKPLSSGIVIGSGGPFGAEGPIIMTGGAIGSLFAQFFKLTAAERKTLLVAGATAGMTAVFGTPVAALLLAVELLLFEWRPRSMLPVAVACAVAGFLRVLVLESGPLFPLDTAPATLPALGSCVVAGLLCGALARSLSMALYKTEDLFGRLPIHWMWWPALGGLVVGIGGYFEPRALGVGYDVIGDLLHNHLAIRVALALLVVKAIIWVIALGSGSSGGVLAPLLMMGAGLGVLIGPVLPGGDPGLWPLVCMAAMLAGVLGAPAHGHRLRLRPHTRCERAAADSAGGGSILRLCRTDDAALDHDREDRAPRLPHLSRIRCRPARAPRRGRGDDAFGADHRRAGHAGRYTRRPLRRHAGAPSVSRGARWAEWHVDRHARPRCAAGGPEARCRHRGRVVWCECPRDGAAR